eukprot:2956637-Rhodomonas_salina.2
MSPIIFSPNSWYHHTRISVPAQVLPSAQVSKVHRSQHVSTSVGARRLIADQVLEIGTAPGRSIPYVSTGDSIASALVCQHQTRPYVSTAVLFVSTRRAPDMA